MAELPELRNEEEWTDFVDTHDMEMDHAESQS